MRQNTLTPIRLIASANDMNVHTLIITNRDDVSVDYIIGKIKTRTDSYLRLNSEDINRIQFEIVPGGNMTCRDGGRTYQLASIKSILFRRIPQKFDLAWEGEDHKYLNHERKHFLEGLYLTFQDAKWINPMFCTQIAERKLHQLVVANKIGLQIPDSILTNELPRALEFLKRHPKCIIKPISNGLQVLTDKVYSIYTTEVTYITFKNLDLNQQFDTPVFLQEKIRNAFDVRVTVVGKQIFAVRIIKDSDEVDWRKPEIVKSYEIVTLPDKIQAKVLHLNDVFGLIYSAIDFIVTPDGEYIFLEVNPVGEWVWLEHELGIDISGSILKELQL